jgi:dihydroxyacetone kinase-like protein
LAKKPLPEALKSIGMTLVMKVGGASGPLYGTLFLTLAKELPADPSATDLARAFQAAFDAVAARGKSTVGQKTMLDVLSPVASVLTAGGAGLAGKVRASAKAAADATVPMKAERGRASFLGDRSIGHMDPGACSSSLMIGVVCDVLEKGRA